MGFTAPLGLLALLALPAVLVLHLFRRRFQERRIAGLFLFAADALPADAGRTRARLLRTPSLWLELLAALVLSLWLAGLHVGAPPAETHLVVVLDDSASMGAVAPGDAVAVLARRDIAGQLDEIGDDAVVTLVLTGRRPSVIVGPRGTPAQARAALEAWAPSQPAHDPAAAWDLALDLAADDGRLRYVTDREAPPPPPRFHHVALGVPLANAAIASARRVPRGAEERVYADLLAWGEAPVETRVTVEAIAGEARTPVAEKAITITPGRTLHLAWTLPAADVPLRITLGEDALAADNVATLLPEPLRIVPVHVALDEATARALGIAQVLAALDDVRVVGSADDAALRVGGADVRVPPGGVALALATPGDERDAWIGPFLLERRRVLGGGEGAPLLAGVTLEGVVWSAGRGALPGLALVLAGEQVLLAEEAVAGGVRVHLNLDPTRSNLATSPDWPILIANIVAAVRDRLPGPVATNVRLGGEIAVRFAGTPDEAAQHVLFAPDGDARRARGWPWITWEARRAGLHVLRRGETEVARFAVNFTDPLESDLTHGTRLDTPPTRGAEVGALGLGRPGEREARVLALLLLLALVLDWVVLGRMR